MSRCAFRCLAALILSLGISQAALAQQPRGGEEAMLPGQVLLIGKAQVSPNYPGTLTKLLVEHGQAVKKGQILALYETSADTLEGIKEQLSDVDLAQARMRVAEANQLAQQANARQRSLQELMKQNMANQPSLARANLDVEVSRRAVDYAQTVLHEVQTVMELRRKQVVERANWEGVPAKLTVVMPLRAPRDGNVVWVKPGLSPGEAFQAGASMFQVAPFDPVQVEVKTHEKEAMRARAGAKALVEFAAFPDKRFETTVDTLNLIPDVELPKNVAPAGSTAAMLPLTAVNPSDSASYYRMTMRLPNPDHSLREGMTVTVRLLD